MIKAEIKEVTQEVTLEEPNSDILHTQTYDESQEMQSN